MFRIDRNLDYGQAIDVDRHESWGSSLLWPAIVRLHSEMPAQDVPLHWHLGAEIIYVVKGRVRMFIDGVETIVNDGQICLVSPKALHAIHPIPYGSEQCVLSISFDGEYLSRMSVGLANHRLLTTMPIGRGCQHSAGRLIDLCNQIIDCINAESDTRFLRLNALLYTLLCELFDVWDDTLFDTGTAGALMTHDGTSLADNDSIMQRGGAPMLRHPWKVSGKHCRWVATSIESPNTWDGILPTVRPSGIYPDISVSRGNTSPVCSKGIPVSLPTGI